jgi:hypothetical protein
MGLVGGPCIPPLPKLVQKCLTLRRRSRAKRPEDFTGIPVFGSSCPLSVLQRFPAIFRRHKKQKCFEPLSAENSSQESDKRIPKRGN